MNEIQRNPLHVNGPALDSGQLQQILRLQIEQFGDQLGQAMDEFRAPTLGQALSLEGRVAQLAKTLDEYGDELSLGLPPPGIDIIPDPTPQQLWANWGKLCQEIRPVKVAKPPPRDSQEIQEAEKRWPRLALEARIKAQKELVAQRQASLESHSGVNLAAKIAGQAMENAADIAVMTAQALANRDLDEWKPSPSALAIKAQIEQDLASAKADLAFYEKELYGTNWVENMNNDDLFLNWMNYEKEMSEKGLKIWEMLTGTCAAWREAYPKPTPLSFQDLESDLPIPNLPRVMQVWELESLRENLERQQLRRDKARSMVPRVFGVCYQCRHLHISGTSQASGLPTRLDGPDLVAACLIRLRELPPTRPAEWTSNTYTNVQDLPRSICFGLEPLSPSLPE